jgi:hypothetical protein
VIKTISGRSLREEPRVGLCDAYDLNLRAVPRLVEEAVDVSVNQTNNGDTER